MTLYSKNGGPLVMLPFQDAMPDGTLYTDLANNAVGRLALGYVEASCPTTVSRMQLRVYMAQMPSGNAATFLDEVDAFVAGQSKVTREYWANVSDLHRDHSLIVSLGAQFGLTSNEIDNIFTGAKAVT